MYFVGARISPGRWAILRAPRRQNSLTTCCSRSHIIVVVKVVVVTVVVIVRVVVVEKMRRRSLVAFTSFFYPFFLPTIYSLPLQGWLHGLLTVTLSFVFTPFPVGQRSGVLWRACLFVCLSASISLKLHALLSTHFVHAACGHGSVLLWRRDVLPYVFPVFCMTSYFPIVKAMEACRCRCSDAVDDGEH